MVFPSPGEMLGFSALFWSLHQPLPTQLTWEAAPFPPCVLVTHLPKMGGLRGGYLEMEEGSVGCQCHSGWRGSQIS